MLGLCGMLEFKLSCENFIAAGHGRYGSSFMCIGLWIVSVPDPKPTPAQIAFSIARGKEGSGRYSAHS